MLPPPPAAPSVAHVAVSPSEKIAERFRLMREREEQKLHEATAASQQGANQEVSEMEGEVRGALELARIASAAAASSTDEIRQIRRP